jgi:hypothetical protein
MAALAEWKNQDSLIWKQYGDGLEASGMGDIAGRDSSVPPTLSTTNLRFMCKASPFSDLSAS